MQDKIERIRQLDSDLKYLSGEYESIVLWGSCPDGDVKFEAMMEWLCENEHVVEHMLKVSKELEAI